jgi:hypothetical protein
MEQETVEYKPEWLARVLRSYFKDLIEADNKLAKEFLNWADEEFWKIPLRDLK